VDLEEGGQLTIKKPATATVGGVATTVPKIPEVSEEQTSVQSTQRIKYDLASVVCYVHDPGNPDKKNLVALINVGPRYHERSVGSPVSQWYIFNDFR
jgi:hypothetical protein